MIPVIGILILIIFLIVAGVGFSDNRALAVAIALSILLLLSIGRGDLVKTEKSELTKVGGIFVGVIDREVINASKAFPQLPLSTDLILVRETYDGNRWLVSWGKNQYFRLETKKLTPEEPVGQSPIGSLPPGE